MSKKLYVGNLSYTTTEDDLQRLFTEVGPVVSVTVITDRDSGQSKGFGFVEMETEAAAQAAIKQLNNHTLNDRNLTVNEARPRDSSSDRGGRRGGPPRGGGNRRRF
jgi:RNA recognition motif-containing protein